MPSLDDNNLAPPVDDLEIQKTPRADTSADSLAQAPRSPQQHLGFDMATPVKEGGETRIIYTNDSDLAAMLESLAKGTDSAKFEIRRSRSDPVPEPVLPERTSETVDEQAQRLRVEAESESSDPHGLLITR
jgi:hypothetical protein